MSEKAAPFQVVRPDGPLPEGWWPEVEWSVRTDLGGGRFHYTPPMYRREHAEREAEWRPGGVVVSRPVHAGPWTED